MNDTDNNETNLPAFTPTEMGDTSKLPFDAPEGGWYAKFKVKKKDAAKDGAPRLIVEALMQTADEEENEPFLPQLGIRGVAEFLTFYSKGHRNYAMSIKRLQSFGKALGIAIPTGALSGWHELDEFCEAIETAPAAHVWTVNQIDKQGIPRTNLAYSEPKKKAPLF